MPISRREICSMLPFAVMAGSLASAADSSRTAPASPALASSFFPFADLPVNQGKGVQFRNIMNGATATGEHVEVHETVLDPGVRPHAPHHHLHSEMWLIREGTVEITINGKSKQIGPGSVAYVTSNEEHGVRNIGSGPAAYFVVAVGVQS
jgi:mannose-6-phosphate isomerase-like protein (cupin superfamily)